MTMTLKQVRNRLRGRGEFYRVDPCEERAMADAIDAHIAAVRKVIESHINEAKNLRHDPELQDYLYEQADKLTAALQEKGNG